MPRLTRRTALLLFGSGYCALVYQMGWLRLLRLIFGNSTWATAAVLAIFMGGLGLGSLILGRRADASPRPLRLYAHLELGIALAAALSPWLAAAAQATYVSLGGTFALGVVAGTAVRLLLAVVVLGLPSFLMGGTLPAAAREVERGADRGRRHTGLLYGANTVGAVLGALATTFVGIELLGIRKSLWVASLINLLVAIAARSLARRLDAFERAGDPPSDAEATGPEPDREGDNAPLARGRVPFLLLAAAFTGFVFFLMELVWYRMLGPILGGSSYTFGLILAVALLGIGVGGLLYGFGAQGRRPTLRLFALTSALEALFLAFPIFLGDSLALFAWSLRPLGATGFAGTVVGWALVTAVVVLPASVAAGYQFPVLVGLLGAGEERVGRQVGWAYAWNTLGALAGSFAGGFGLIPLLTAPGAWRLGVALMASLALVAALLEPERRPGGRALPAALALLASGLLLAQGPTAPWRHGGIGAGRARFSFTDRNDVRREWESERHSVLWEADGRESSVALRAAREMAFFVNGKSDGTARGDAPTIVMSGLVGALLHPAPHRSLVVGLGTGASAGWLAAVPSMEEVTVVELEPVIEEVARMSGPVNHWALDNPKLSLVFGDGRELLLTHGETYDLIFSEPSNPYRAGISSLFTRDFYEAANRRLAPGGLFLQWFQGYEVDAQVVRTAYATLASVFPHVESWQTHLSDLLLVASQEPIVHDTERLRRRLREEPYRKALRDIWAVSDLEGLYTGYLASADLARLFALQEGDHLNTDDHPIIEYGFARNLGRTGLFEIDDLYRLARQLRLHRPVLRGTPPDWSRVEDLRSARLVALGGVPEPPAWELEKGALDRLLARRAFAQREPEEAIASWLDQTEPPLCRVDLLLLADSFARLGDDRAAPYLDQLAAISPTEADAIRTIWHFRQKRPEEAFASLLSAVRSYHRDPWPIPELIQDALTAGRELVRGHGLWAQALYRELEEPFAVYLLEDKRLHLRVELTEEPGLADRCVEAFEPWKAHPAWELTFLQKRLRCYQATHHPMAAQAAQDLGDYLAATPPPLVVPSVAEN